MVGVVGDKRDVEKHDAGVDREVHSLPLRKRVFGPGRQVRKRNRDCGGLGEEASPAPGNVVGRRGRRRGFDNEASIPREGSGRR